MSLLRVREPLKTLADGLSDHTIDATSVAELLRKFEQANPALSGWILDERGCVRRHINVFVNGERAAGSTPVGPADKIDVLPAISGG